MTNIEPILVDTKTACRLLGIKKTLCFQYLKNGQLQRVKMGRKTVISMESIRKLAAGGAS